MNKIIIKNADLHLHIGITEEERKDLQPIIVDLTMDLDHPHRFYDAAINDDVSKTINYAEVHRRIRCLANEKYKTVEAFCYAIARTINLQFPACDDATILVKKPYALSHQSVEYAAVEMHYNRVEFERLTRAYSRPGKADAITSN